MIVGQLVDDALDVASGGHGSIAARLTLGLGRTTGHEVADVGMTVDNLLVGRQADALGSRLVGFHFWHGKLQTGQSRSYRGAKR